MPSGRVLAWWTGTGMVDGYWVVYLEINRCALIVNVGLDTRCVHRKFQVCRLSTKKAI